MTLLKPKTMALKLNIPPEKLSILANEIENAHIYQFNKTTFGSYLFLEEEYYLLKEYIQLLFFFQKKQIALHMLKQQSDALLPEKEGTPDWTKWLHNAVFVK